MSDLSSHDSSLDTTDSPSINMDNNNHDPNATSKHIINSSCSHSSFPEDLKPQTNTNTNNLLFTPNTMHNYDDLLFNTTNDINSNPMDFLMMDLTQQASSNHTTNINNINNITSPVLDFQNHLNGNINITPSLNALTNGLFELNNSNPNTPHLPPLNIDANSQQNTNTIPPSTTNDNHYNIPTIPTMPIVNPIGNNIPPPTQDLDWQTFCTLINNNNNNINNNNNNRKRKKENENENEIDEINNEIENKPTKKRKLNNNNISENKNNKEKEIKKKKRGRPRKNADNKITIKREKKEKNNKKKKICKKNDSDDEYNMDEYLSTSYGTESYVGIRTDDGEVRIQIPPNPKCENNSNYSKVKFTVFGNACSDKIEDILQPKKRTRYVRGLSEEEKKTRRREQNRNAAARSRARKNAMISKVIQLHQENMGLRAFVAENITQTKILRDEINRLNTVIMLQQQQPQQQQQQTQSSLFDIINQDSSTLFQNK